MQGRRGGDPVVQGRRHWLLLRRHSPRRHLCHATGQKETKAKHGFGRGFDGCRAQYWRRRRRLYHDGPVGWPIVFLLTGVNSRLEF